MDMVPTDDSDSNGLAADKFMMETGVLLARPYDERDRRYWSHDFALPV